MPDKKEFKCLKCGSQKHKVEQRVLTRTGVSRFMNIQRHLYYLIIREECGFVEMYEKERASKAGQLLDFFSN
ncbi:zinc ribbon domain-containing protein [Thermoproteota archaeon]